jgi:predicted metalloprotease with PDZ domain
MPLFTLLCVFFVSTNVLGEVRHSLGFPVEREQIFLMSSEFPVNAELTELVMPNWTPGSYLIREHSANINHISASSANGAALQIEKVSKDRWHVDTSQVSTLRVDYEVYTPRIGVQTSWASKAWSLVNGASVFLYTEQTRQMPQRLDISVDTGRGQAFTALPVSTDGSGFLAGNYDELVDNPVVIADAPSYSFTHDEGQYVLLNVGENEFWDGKKAVGDVEKIVATIQSFWGDNPLRRPYWFLNFINEANGGLEHDQSTVIMTGRGQMRDRQEYIKWLGIVAHEFFHVWNVRHMRPAELDIYDYQQEQYTDQLWIAEGLTSYYDNLILSRAGLIGPQEYLELLAKTIHRLETTPGRLIRPVTEASFDTWIRHYKPNSNTANTTISYYTKGAIIGFILDTYLRKESGGRRSLDDVMRRMYQLYSNRSYGNDAFEKVVAEVGGAEAGMYLNSLLTTTADPDIDSALDWYGLEVDRGVPGEADGQDGEPPRSGFGVHWDETRTGMFVSLVLAGSAAESAGLMPGDEVLAIGKERLTPATLDKLMNNYQPGEETSLLISRRGAILKLEIKLGVAIPTHYEIGLKEGYRQRQIKRLRNLLGQDAPG